MNLELSSSATVLAELDSGRKDGEQTIPGLRSCKGMLSRNPGGDRQTTEFEERGTVERGTGTLRQIKNYRDRKRLSQA